MRTVIAFAIFAIFDASFAFALEAESRIASLDAVKVRRSRGCPKDRRQTAAVITVRRRDFKRCLLNVILF